MTINSIILFGITLGILLIFSCISLEASKFYNELACTMSIEVNTKEHNKLVLQDRMLLKKGKL